MVIIAVVTLISYTAQEVIFNKTGIQVTETLWLQAFVKLTGMPLGWFDEESHMSGNLTANMLIDVKHILKYACKYIPVTVYILSSFIFGLTISLVYDWRTSLISLALFPFIVLSVYLQYYYLESYSSSSDKNNSKGFQLVL